MIRKGFKRFMNVMGRVKFLYWDWRWDYYQSFIGYILGRWDFISVCVVWDLFLIFY